MNTPKHEATYLQINRHLTILVKLTLRKSRIPRPGVVGGYSLPETLRLYPGEYPRPSGWASLRGYHSASGKASLRESDPGTGRDTLPVSQWGSGWGPLPGPGPESPGEPGGAPLSESGTLSGPASLPGSGRASGPVRGSCRPPNRANGCGSESDIGATKARRTRNERVRDTTCPSHSVFVSSWPSISVLGLRPSAKPPESKLPAATRAAMLRRVLEKATWSRQPSARRPIFRLRSSVRGQSTHPVPATGRHLDLARGLVPCGRQRRAGRLQIVD